MLNRREFLKVGFLTVGIVIIIDNKIAKTVSFEDSIKVLYTDLFPDIDSEISYQYLKNIILTHSKITDREKDFIRDGVKWLNKDALSIHNTIYPKLKKQQREDILKNFSKTQRGEEWLYMMMGYMFESILADPIYGLESDKWWKWLDFEVGNPRPYRPFL
jgi:hypothetical protein